LSGIWSLYLAAPNSARLSKLANIGNMCRRRRRRKAIITHHAYNKTTTMNAPWKKEKLPLQA
jgi:hypothetical protein